jgi:hypothetical protein
MIAYYEKKVECLVEFATEQSTEGLLRQGPRARLRNVLLPSIRLLTDE